MKSVSFFLLAVLGLVACMGVDNKPPENILPMEQMASILADIHVLEGAVSTKELPKDTSLLLFNELENQMLEKKGISQQQFKESYNWYTLHVTAYKDLYTQVVDTLNVRTNNETSDSLKQQQK